MKAFILKISVFFSLFLFVHIKCFSQNNIDTLIQVSYSFLSCSHSIVCANSNKIISLWCYSGVNSTYKVNETDGSTLCSYVLDNYSQPQIEWSGGNLIGSYTTNQSPQGIEYSCPPNNNCVSVANAKVTENAFITCKVTQFIYYPPTICSKGKFYKYITFYQTGVRAIVTPKLNVYFFKNGVKYSSLDITNNEQIGIISEGNIYQENSGCEFQIENLENNTITYLLGSALDTFYEGISVTSFFANSNTKIRARYFSWIIGNSEKCTGEWSEPIFVNYNYIDPNLITISNLTEQINQTSYRVPREATIHHYFLAKKTSNPTIPVIGAVLKYTIGTDPTLRSSLPSDNDGLIDLNITVGGTEVNNQADDWIPKSGTLNLNTFYPVQFHSLAVGTISGTNAFTPFQVKVIDKAIDYKQELGIGIGFKGGQDAFQNSETEKIDMGDGLRMNLKGEVGLKAGVTTDAYIKIKPISENNWNVYLNGGLGVFTGLGIDFGIGVQYKGLNVGTKVKSDIDLNGGIRAEVGYNFNLNNKQELFKLAEFLFSLNVADANSKETSIIFRNLAERSEPALTNLSYSSAFSFGAGFSIGAEASAKNKLRLINLPGYGNIPALGLEAKINAAGKFNDMIKYEVEKNVGYHESNSIDVSSEASNVINGLVELTKGNRKNNPSTKSQPFSNLFGSLENNFTIQRSFSTSDHSNPIGGLLSYSSKSSELSLIPSRPEIKFNKVFTNKYYYGENAIKNLYIAAFNPLIIEKLNFNTLALFLTNRSNILVGSAWINDGLTGSMFNQMYDLNTYMTKTVKDFNLPSEQIKMISEQEITLIDKGSKSFTLPKFKKRGFEINYTSWNTYTHKHKESKYIKTLDRTLLTLDYPEISENLELPLQDPITILKNKLVAELNQIGQDIMDSVQEFITSITQTINNAVTIVLTNFNLPRKTAEGKILIDPLIKTVNSITPSVFTFTIPNNTFQTNTNLDFSFYFPNNEVIAITPNDTFRIISDVFTLKAIFNSTNLNTTQNGNFNINTNFSTSDLEFASLPANLIPSVLFLPNGSYTWQVIGGANVDIPFSQMGIFALGVKISNDKVPPTINVLNPIQYVTPNYYEITLSDNKSGIDWAKSIVTANGKKMTINRISNGNTFRIPINEIPSNSSGIFIIEAKALDLAGNPNTYFSIYPCEEQIIVKGLELDPGNPILKKALNKIASSTITPSNKDLIFRAGKSIELNVGFETKGKTFKAEIGGCSN